ncbi:hypothetical protein E4U32_003236 [Claviceps aff. humidiphila group G2b]|nr:hypothetical protein E4U32_003236 [Claviceps aff. humidiphila group G2b]
MPEHSASTTGRPLRYHGTKVSSSRETKLWFAQFDSKTFTKPELVATFVAELVEKLWVPQTRLFMARQLRRRLHQSKINDAEVTTHDIQVGHNALALWEETRQPFTMEALERLKEGLKRCGTRGFIDTTALRTRQDHMRDLVSGIGDKRKRGIHSSKDATWPDPLLQAMAVKFPEADHWAIALDVQFRASGIEWVPGSPGGRITSTAVVRLQNTKTAIPLLVPAGESGTFLREVSEVTIEGEKRMQRQAAERERPRINFGCKLPFITIPDLIVDGLAKSRKILASKSDRLFLGHYELAMNTLTTNLQHPLCQYMLMLILTVCSSTDTPQVLLKATEFSVSMAGKRKDPAQLALAMATRMLWFVYPRIFPWQTDPYSLSCGGSEMAKKLGMYTSRVAVLNAFLLQINNLHGPEKLGCCTRMLRMLGWVTVRGARENPRHIDLTLTPQADLLKEMCYLKSAMKRPYYFFYQVFKSPDEMWMERCQSIIRRSRPADSK